MKKWQDFALWVVLFVLWGVLSEFVESGIEIGMFSDWFFVLFNVFVFALAWVGVFFWVKKLENKSVKKTSKNVSFLKFGIEFVLFWSVFMAFDIVRYLLKHNTLNDWSLLVGCTVFIFIGWFCGRFGNILFKSKK